MITILTLVSLFMVTAPYGRHLREGWGPRIKAVWAWVIMEMPVLLAFPVYLWISGASLNLVTGIFTLMWMGHYGYRTLYYPWQRRNVLKTYPVLIPLLAIFYNLINGYTNAWYIYAIHPGYTLSWLSDPRFLIGLSLFLVGFGINCHSDRVLLRLKTPEDPTYKIPKDGLHRQVASPNYFGEILEWTGWAIATWSPAGLLFAAYTFANLAPRAHSNLKWYRENFPDYPKDRKALVPYIW